MHASARQRSDDELADAVLAASRVLVDVAARSAASVREVTLPQYRALVVLGSAGPRPLTYLAERLRVSPSTATRMCDRLERKGLVVRRPSEQSRRTIEVSITGRGREVVDLVVRRRREEVAAIVTSIPEHQRDTVAAGLRVLAAACYDMQPEAWSLGWPA